ncbi:hypothetical protein GT347_26150 [Xylophilus rhododendri]|uniref:Uncharacterized protein n=2 Tax=Xylophilus rhododendri TaxID=2697032 RepID=A0A857JF10_9BURK|nr:hypothetical protein GT347_26150 [Xylophilus rhododendri]
MAAGAPVLARAGRKKAEATSGAEPKAGKKSTKVKLAPHGDSGESTADRSRRMQRECRGRPNAGACSGYGYGS